LGKIFSRGIEENKTPATGAREKDRGKRALCPGRNLTRLGVTSNSLVTDEIMKKKKGGVAGAHKSEVC